jgi:hypothetical protein
MRNVWVVAFCAAVAGLACAGGSLRAQDLLPQPADAELIDVPNDDGTRLGVLFRLDGSAPEGTGISIRALANDDLLKPFVVSDAERNTLNNAFSALEQAVSGLLLERDSLAADVSKFTEELAPLVANNDPAARAKRAEMWDAKNKLDRLQAQIDHAKDAFTAKAGKINEKAEKYDALSAAMAASTHFPTDGGADPAALDTKGAHPDIFGQDPPEADKAYIEVGHINVPNPRAAAETQNGHDKYDIQPSLTLQVPLTKGQMYVLQMVVTGPAPAQAAPEAAAEQAMAEEAAAVPAEPGAEAGADAAQAAPPVMSLPPLERTYELGGAKPAASLFKTTLIIILVAITRARRNPNMFIRRISGLEAVDEAIGRATEMGKPVLYLNGMNDLSDLSTLAAINILGRVARRIADYDSDLIVPTRDPVVMTVAQEVVREGYIDVGRPDSFKQDNIFFVTDDQFAFTAATCGIMLRDKPAATFFMGYYYAESLLLAETGASIGAIQIAGTDSQSQLPFFITTCDYTLIGEELYAASAYLSREPMLLGSLKGQDFGKAVLMLIIILQTLLFLVMALTGASGWDYIKNLIVPL